MNTSIYALCEPSGGELRYIGKSKYPAVRFKNHLWTATTGNRAWRSNWIRSLGVAPTMIILAIVPDEIASAVERLFIAHYRSQIGCRLTNLTDGGEGVLGHKHSPETCAKMSASALKRPSRAWVKPFFSEESLQRLRVAQLGRRHTPEHIARAAKHLLGHRVSAATREKIGESHRGRVFTDEHRAKLSAWQIGKYVSPETRKRMSESQTRAHAERRRLKAGETTTATPP